MIRSHQIQSNQKEKTELQQNDYDQTKNFKTKQNQAIATRKSFHLHSLVTYFFLTLVVVVLIIVVVIA